MQTLPIFQIDAFTQQAFSGNPAAVCLLEAWLTDSTLQNIAAENNLSETAFIVPVNDTNNSTYELRWFTPTVEIPLCGHATLASAWVLFNELSNSNAVITFKTLSGDLQVQKTSSSHGQQLQMSFPQIPAHAVPDSQQQAKLITALGCPPQQILRADNDNWLAVYTNQAQVLALQPDFPALIPLGRLGVIATAPGDNCDFVSRYFVPAAGINEDPVTGSAHCTLTPYWAEKLQKKSLHAQQISQRGGELYCELSADRVFINGSCVKTLAGELFIPGEPE